MTVDIIIPFYNALKTIDKTLASIAMQKVDDGTKLKITIVNDASPDCSYEKILEKISNWEHILDINVINKLLNAGPAQARQAGIDMSDGDYIMFIDADDVLGSPFSIRSLLREITSKDNDMVVGMFVEENPEGIIINHYENYVWLHGKMFKRRFLERFNIRFNDTYFNEDVGFNNLCRCLTDRISYIDHVCYIWLNQGGSMVRTNRDAYAFGYGWRGFVENLTWDIEELFARRINKGIILKFATETMCRLYWQLQDSNNHLNDENEKTLNIEKVKEYYTRAMKPLVLDGAVTLDYLCQAYSEMITSFDNKYIVPSMSFNQYLTMLGYIEDIENLKGATING